MWPCRPHRLNVVDYSELHEKHMYITRASNQGKRTTCPILYKARNFQQRFHVSMIMNNNFHQAIRAISNRSFQLSCALN